MQKPYFLYVGNAYPHKNLRRAIVAFANYNIGHSKKMYFAIASSRNVFTKRVEKMISDNNAGEYIKLLGFVPDSELKILYKNAECYLFPSLYEGFGLPGLEAMAQGTLVAASDIPVFKEIYKDNVIYFNPLDSNSIERIIDEVVNMDAKERKRITGKAKIFIKRYSWEKMAKETLDVYNEALK